MAQKGKYTDAFNEIVASLQKPNSGKDTMNSPNLTKGGISISKDLIPDDVKPGDVILLRVADVDPDKGEVHFEYLNKQSNETENSPETSGVNENETEKTSPLLQ